MTDGHPTPASFKDMVEFALRINGREHQVRVEPRVTLLDLLRERLALTGTKKGCNFGECGASRRIHPIRRWRWQRWMR